MTRTSGSDIESEAATRLLVDTIASPVGEILLVVHGESIVAIEFNDRFDKIDRRLRRRFGAYEREDVNDPHGFSGRIRDYFSGDSEAFEGCDLDPGGTSFQRDVWDNLVKISWGETMSYGELAKRVGRPKASRAVGAANGQNPIAIALPCHRVVGANGSLTGYGGGIARKQWLLAHEAEQKTLFAERPLGSDAPHVSQA